MPRLCLALLLLAGCGDDAPSAPAREAPTAPTAAPEAPAEDGPAAPPAASEREARAFEERAPAVDAAKVRQYRRALAEARAAHRADDDARAIERYRAAVALDANGGALCELGWVLFQAGQTDEARGALERGLALLPASDPVPERFRGPVGACLYNLGRLEEDAVHVEAARRHYARSLAVRPGNATVQGRLDALPAAPAAEARAPGLPACPAEGRALDLAGWARSVSTLEGAPARFASALAQVGMSAPTDAEFVDVMGFGPREEGDPPALSARVATLDLALGERRGKAVHVRLSDELGNSVDQVAVLVEQAEGRHCLAGVIDSSVDMCSTSCLGDATPLSLSTVRLLADDVDSLRVVVTSGACSCGADRGVHAATSLHSVMGDALVEHLSITTTEAWYTSPRPPSSWREAEIEPIGEGFPRRLRVTTTVECDAGCTRETIAEAEAAIEAAEDDDARQELQWQLEDECGDTSDPCAPSEETVTYVLRGAAYTPE